MSAGRGREPVVFRDTFALVQWIQERLADQPRPLPRAICGNGLRLLEAITLALAGREKEARIEEADERLAVLRVQLRLALEIEALGERPALFALEKANEIGRQLGGWLRHLEAS